LRRERPARADAVLGDAAAEVVRDVDGVPMRDRRRAGEHREPERRSESPHGFRLYCRLEWKRSGLQFLSRPTETTKISADSPWRAPRLTARLNLRVSGTLSRTGFPAFALSVIGPQTSRFGPGRARSRAPTSADPRADTSPSLLSRNLTAKLSTSCVFLPITFIFSGPG